jgi:hypothetical protein
MADLDANISSMIDPASLQKLMALRDQLGSQASQAPYDAAQAASQAAQPTSYDALFGQNAAMQNQLAPQLANKSAAESAQVLASAPEAAAAEAAGTDAAATAAGEAAAGGASKFLGPIAALLGIYNGPTAPSSLADVPGAKSPKELSQQGPLPWGGMSDKQLADYVKYKDTGPVAKVGFNPNAVVGPPKPDDLAARQTADQQDEDDDEDEDTTPSGAGPASAKTAAKPSTTPTPSATSQPSSVADLLSKLGLSNDKLAKAQQAQRLGSLFGADAAVGEKIAAALSRGAYKPDYTMANQINAMAAMPVQQAMQQQTAAKEAVDTGLKLSDFQDKQQLQDASSPISQAYRNMAATLNPQLAQAPNFENMSAEAIKGAQPMVDASLKAQTMQLIRQQMAQQREGSFAERQQIAQNQKDDASEMKLAQGLSQMQSQRGAAGMAAKTEQLADRALSMANNYTPDQNDLTKQQVAALYNDANQIMTGGVSTQHGIETVFPETYKSSLDNLMQKISNTPTGADMGPFVQQLSKQMQLMKNEAQSFKKDRAAEYLMGYKDSLGQRRPDTFNAYKKKFGVSDDDMNPSAVANSIPNPGQHPDDKKMLDWAQQNMNSSDPATKQAAMQVIQANMQGTR